MTLEETIAVMLQERDLIPASDMLARDLAHDTIRRLNRASQEVVRAGIVADKLRARRIDRLLVLSLAEYHTAQKESKDAREQESQQS